MRSVTEIVRDVFRRVYRQRIAAGHEGDRAIRTAVLGPETDADRERDRNATWRAR